MIRFEFDASGIESFAAKLHEAAGDMMRGAMAGALEELALKFLDQVSDEIIAVGNIDTGQLLNSFGRGGADNVFMVADGGLEVTVGTAVKYADWVNTGHTLRNGEWWEGSHYFDTAYDGFSDEFRSEILKKLSEWLRVMFG